MKRAALFTLLATLAIAFPRTGHAQDSPALKWDEDWDRFRPGEFALTGVMAGGALVSWGLLDNPSSGWERNLVIDDAFRGWLVSATLSGRKTARSVGDALIVTLLATPLLLDDAVLAWGVGKSPEVAQQLALIDMQSFMTTLFVTTITKKTIKRARPFVPDCRADATDPNCGQDDQFRSFISGHSALSFTAASLVCLHHKHLRLTRSKVGGKIMCYATLTAATTVGVMRIVGDKHHATDILAGAAVGILSGYVMPTLFHFRKRDPEAVAVQPFATPESLGLALGGRF